MTYLYELGTAVPRDPPHQPGRIRARLDHPRMGLRYLVAWPEGGRKTWLNEATVTQALKREAKRA